MALLSLLIVSCNNKKNQFSNTQVIDSVSVFIKNSYSKELSNTQKLLNLKKAYQKIILLPEDSIKPSKLSSIAYRYYQLKDTSMFFKINKTTIELAEKRKDSFTIADAHWSYAEFYLNKEVYNKAFFHYDKAYQYFSRIDEDYKTARMVYAMAFIKGRYHDYSGSEVMTFKAIETFKKLNNYQYLFLAYNNLASLQNDIKNYTQALVYHEKAAGYLEEYNNKKYRIWNLNNIGSTYLKMEKYSDALFYFNKALDQKADLYDYAMIIDNISYCKLLMKDTAKIKQQFLRSMNLRDSLNASTGLLTSKIRTAKYFAYAHDTIQALKFATEAKNLSLKLRNGTDYLHSLELLSKYDPKNSPKYLLEHIRFNDSLTNSERETLNKFTRIEFETDEIIEKNEILTQQRVWIFSASIALILILSLLYFLRVQRVKNEKLFLETEQQKANEQVYLLTLKQQATLEEEKARERNRISQELHDGILGRLFGTRVGLGFLDLNADEKTQEQHEAFLDELQDIEKEIREVSHKLNDNFAGPDINFTSIVTQLLESKSQIGDFQFHLNIDENISWKSTDEIIKVNVYRIIQETLQNTIKHAQAKNVILDFSSNEQELSVLIQDDGVGFNMKKSKKGIGLKNMKSRVEKLNGTLEITSAMNKGTQIHIKIPIV